jgi:DNA polymerase III delta prime subunit
MRDPTAVTIPAPMPGTARAPQPAPAQPKPPPTPPPPPAGAFVGRRSELAALDALHRAGGPDPVRLTAISGPPGVGKTALALAWAKRAGERFPDGHIYVDLDLDADHGVDPDRAGPGAAARRLLAAFGVPSPEVPGDDLADQVARYRGIIADRRALVVFDNADSAEQVRPLLPGAPGCRAVVISRAELPRLASLDGARPLRLGTLSQSECRQLFSARLGSARVRRETDAIDRLVELCGGLAMVLTRVAAYAAGRPDSPLWSLVNELEATVARPRPPTPRATQAAADMKGRVPS